MKYWLVEGKYWVGSSTNQSPPARTWPGSWPFTWSQSPPWSLMLLRWVIPFQKAFDKIYWSRHCNVDKAHSKVCAEISHEMTSQRNSVSLNCLDGQNKRQAGSLPQVHLIFNYKALSKEILSLKRKASN